MIFFKYVIMKINLIRFFNSDFINPKYFERLITKPGHH